MVGDGHRPMPTQFRLKLSYSTAFLLVRTVDVFKTIVTLQGCCRCRGRALCNSVGSDRSFKLRPGEELSAMGIHSTARCRLARVSVELERCQWQVIPRCIRKANKSEVKITSAKTTTRWALLGLRPLQGGRSRGPRGPREGGRPRSRPKRQKDADEAFETRAERSRAQTAFCTALYTDTCWEYWRCLSFPSLRWIWSEINGIT